MYKRKTKDEYDLMGFYDGVLTSICTEDTLKEAKERLKEYRDNDPYVTALHIKKRRVKIKEEFL